MERDSLLESPILPKQKSNKEYICNFNGALYPTYLLTHIPGLTLDLPNELIIADKQFFDFCPEHDAEECVSEFCQRRSDFCFNQSEIKEVLSNNIHVSHLIRNLLKDQEIMFGNILAVKNEEILKLQKKYDIICKEFTGLRSTLKRFTTRSISFQRENEDLKNQITKITEEKNDLCQQIQNLKEEIEKLNILQVKKNEERKKLQYDISKDEIVLEQINNFPLCFRNSIPPALYSIFESLLQKISELQEMNSTLIEHNKQLQAEVEKYKERIDQISTENDILESKYNSLENENKKLLKCLHQKDMLIAKLKKEYSKAKNSAAIILRNKHLAKSSIVEEIEKRITNEMPPTSYTHDFLNDLVANDKVHLQGRRFTQKTIELCYILYVYSPASYKLLRKILPLPSRQDVSNLLKDSLKRKAQNLLNLDQMKFLLEEIRDSYKEPTDEEHDEFIPAAIASDAASCDPQKTNTGGVFCFQLQPIDQKYESKVVHISMKENTRVGENELKIPKRIAEESDAKKIKIIYSCTDGDPKTNSVHKDFSVYVQQCKTNDFSKLLDHVNNYQKLIPISDWLHILKNLRSRLIKNTIIISELQPPLEFKKICEAVNELEIVYQNSASFAMRDDLALLIFNTKTLASRLEEGYWNIFLFILPFVLTTIVLQSNVLTIQARLQLLDLSYHLIDEISKGSASYPQSSTQKIVRYLRDWQMIRAKNTILAIGHALKFYSNGIAFSRLGTHLVEFVFSKMRQMSYNNNNCNTLANAIIKAEFTKDILQRYGLQDGHKGRIDFAGSRYKEDQWVLSLPIVNNDIYREVAWMLNNQIDNAGELPNLFSLIDFIVTSSPSPSISLSGTLAGSQPYARNLAYSKKE